MNVEAAFAFIAGMFGALTFFLGFWYAINEGDTTRTHRRWMQVSFIIAVFAGAIAVGFANK